MRCTVFGTGYLGATHAAGMAELGHEVLGVDIDPGKIAKLSAGEIPFYEPDLAEILRDNLAVGRLRFTTDYDQAADFADVHFLGVGTPQKKGEYGADLRHVHSVIDELVPRLRRTSVIVGKSTVPVGTADKVKAAISEELAARGVSTSFSVVSNPEFLKEGAAIEDFMRPDRIVVGTDDNTAKDLMRSLYAPFQRNHERVIFMDVRSAELTKYAANAMLATRISFMNELANLAERLGADIELVRQGIGSDPRIGFHFLYPGVGYGGSCFPKDVQALQRTGDEAGLKLRVLEAVEAANEAQKSVLVDKVLARFGDNLSGLTFAMWGLAFKPNTDDMREAPSLVVIRALLDRGAKVVAYDPVATHEAERMTEGWNGLGFGKSSGGVLQGADALLILTEWKEFRSPDFEAIRASLNNAVIFDGRNLYQPDMLAKSGFEYYPIGRAQPVK